MAYLARASHGPVLFVGDTAHTAWGWNEGVDWDQRSASDSDAC